jgi:hypothetical protein
MGTGTGDDFRISGTDASGLPGVNWTTCPEWFKKSGFNTLGGGKTFHPNSPPEFDYPTSWYAILTSSWYGEMASRSNDPPRPADR